MNVRRESVLCVLGVLLATGSRGHGMATEQIGPDSRHPTVSQRDWPKGSPWLVLTDENHIVTKEGFRVNELPAVGRSDRP